MLNCPNCGKSLKEEDVYCRFCGTKYSPGQPAQTAPPMDPLLSIMHASLYGPPFSVKCTCSACGSEFLEHGLGSPRKTYYCPKCGAKCAVAKSSR